jgi:hypothetical protein
MTAHAFEAFLVFRRVEIKHALAAPEHQKWFLPFHKAMRIEQCKGTKNAINVISLMYLCPAKMVFA